MSKYIISILALASLAQFASADNAGIKFLDVKNPLDVFSLKTPGQATFIYGYSSYPDWASKPIGKNFPMEVAPVITGMNISGGVKMADPVVVDPNKFSKDKLLQEFAGVVNLRNRGGRSALEVTGLSDPHKLLLEEFKSTYVVQTVMSGVIPRPFSQLKISPESFFEMLTAVDADHSHFKISGDMVLNTLDKNHVAARTVAASRGDYVLSVFDFRDYACPVLKNNLRDQFNGANEKQRLQNESLYVISDLQMGLPADIAGAKALLGREPQAVLSQSVIFADHLIRGARTVFVFFAEGDTTRVVLISNIGLRSKYFTGKGMIKRQLILDGPNGAFGGTVGATLRASDKVTSVSDQLLRGADQDTSEKNTCDRGLGLGLIKYSQSLYSAFAEYLSKR